MSEEQKYPWESKTEWIAFMGVTYGLLHSLGYIGSIPAELYNQIVTFMFFLIMIVRKAGGGKIVFLK